MKAKKKLIQICLAVITLLNIGRSEAQTVTAISAGQITSYVLRSDGSVGASGENNFGQLGNGTNSVVFSTNRLSPVLTSNITAISAGYGHTLFLRNDGVMLGTGYNAYGQLGDGTNTNVNIPIPIASNVVTIAATELNSFFIDSNGVLWGTGYNLSGTVGNGTNGLTYQFQMILTGVTAAVGGDQHSLFLRTDGSIWATGYNNHGQLGLGTSFGATSFSTNRPFKIVAGNVTAISAGEFHSVYITASSNLYGMGDNVYGEMGDGTTAPYVYSPELIDTSVVAVSAGEYHTLYIKSGGSLWSMGYNQEGALGDGNYNNTNRPQMIVASNVVAISAGDEHSLFQMQDGSVWAMGNDGDGQLADGLHGTTNQPEEIIFGTNLPPGFGLLIPGLPGGGLIKFSYIGMIGTNYALDRTTNLFPANWIPQSTNQANAGGKLAFTNIFKVTTNNFWRVRALSQ
jgi:alpha-tubulin suppressor-like RCC1 family protein